MARNVQERILLSDEPVRSLDDYRAMGGCTAYDAVLRADPDSIIELIREAGLRGRGGAGFPTAVKWQGARRSPGQRKFVCANGAEGEPGTFKDRLLLRTNPYQVLEGLGIAAHVVGAESAFICLKRNFTEGADAVQRALEEMRAETHIVDIIELILGPDEYLYGEETALLEVVDGGLPLPHVFPPYIQGLFSAPYGGPSDIENNPTVVNNVETLAHVPHIVNRGAEWFRSMGTDDTPGTMIFSISGDVQRPTVREMSLGVTLRQLIFDVAGGPQPGRSVRAVFAGLANAAITPDMLEVPLGFDSMRRAGSALGSGGFIVYDDTACMVQAAYEFSRFLHVESCNQCPPCKIGSRYITEALTRLLSAEADREDCDVIHHTTTWVENGHRCYLATSEAVVIASILRAFPEDFDAHVRQSCERRHYLILPKFTDYVEGRGFSYDGSYVRKRPDWTYEPEL